MQSLGTAHLLVLVVFVALVLDSRRLHSLARSAARGRRDTVSGHGIPPGANPDRVGLTLGQIQMRHHFDWQDGGIGWEGPEILPVDEPDVAPELPREKRDLIAILASPDRAAMWAHCLTPQ